MRERLLMIAVVLGACGIDEPAEQTTADELYARGSRIWHTTSIPVCWDNATANNATERAWVQDAVWRSWSAVSYATFNGWQSCTSFWQAGLHITISDEQPHTVTLGSDLDSLLGGMVLNFTFANWGTSCQADREACIRKIAVHEFGHALGFAHEQNRPDTPGGCNDVAGGSGDTTLGGWDLDSVMNYCNPSWNGGGVLSAGDIAGVRQYYGSPVFAGNRKAAIVWPTNKIYFFNGASYTRYDVATDRTDSGYPAPIIGQWPGWPAAWNDGADAAVEWGNGKVYFFHGSQYLRYDIAGDHVDGTYLTTADFWPGWPASWTQVDAAFRYGTKAYFFRGGQYLSYDLIQDRVEPGYPRSIVGDWPGVYVADIDYALVHPNGYAYFFKQGHYRKVYMPTRTSIGEAPMVGWWPGVPF